MKPRKRSIFTNKQELNVKSEVPITIHDFSTINDWEKLISYIDEKLLKWKELTSSEPKLESTMDSSFAGSCHVLKEQVIHEDSDMQFAYVSLPRENVDNLEDTYEEYMKYYSETHCELLTSKSFPSISENDSIAKLIVSYFGVSEFIYIKLKKDTGKRNKIKYYLSALKIAIEQSK